MTSRSVDHPLALPDPDTSRRMREALLRHDFHTGWPLELLGLHLRDLASLRPQGRALSSGLWKTRGGTPRDTLVRLFLLGYRVDAEEAARALAPSPLEDWTAASVLAREGDALSSNMLLAPVQGLLLVSDALWTDGPMDRHVMGCAGSTLTLMNLTLRRPSRATLDLGTGNGIHALLAAGHSDRVVGTDLNPRAANLTAFNARFNGLENVEARAGDLYEPVRDEQFDLVVANPPFVISPERQFLFRDGGLPGDELSRRALREGTERLHEGGYLQMVFEWAHRQGEDPSARVQGWLEGTGCDAWLVRITTHALEEHAETWVGAMWGGNPEQFTQGMERWLNYYEQEGIEAIHYGFVTARRRSGKNWFAYDDSVLLAGPAGDSIARGFAQRDFLHQIRDPEQVLATRFRLSEEVRLEQQMVPSAEGWAVRQAQLRSGSGLGFHGEPNPSVMGLIDRCRGERTLGEVVQDLAASVGEEVDPRSCLGVVAILVEHGFLLPLTDPPPEG